MHLLCIFTFIFSYWFPFLYNISIWICASVEIRIWMTVIIPSLLGETLMSEMSLEAQSWKKWSVQLWTKTFVAERTLIFKSYSEENIIKNAAVQVVCVWGGPCLSSYYRGLRKDVYNHTSHAVRSFSSYTHSYQLLIKWQFAEWLKIAPFTYCWIVSLQQRLVSVPSLAKGRWGGRYLHCQVGVLWNFAGVMHVDSALHWRFKINIKHRGKWEERSRTMTEMEGGKGKEREGEIRFMKHLPSLENLI